MLMTWVLCAVEVYCSSSGFFSQLSLPLKVYEGVEAVGGSTPEGFNSVIGEGELSLR